MLQHIIEHDTCVNTNSQRGRGGGWGVKGWCWGGGGQGSLLAQRFDNSEVFLSWL